MAYGRVDDDCEADTDTDPDTDTDHDSLFASFFRVETDARLDAEDGRLRSGSPSRPRGKAAFQAPPDSASPLATPLPLSTPPSSAASAPLVRQDKLGRSS